MADDLIDRLEEHARTLRDFSEAYPAHIFTPLTPLDRARVGPVIITRCSAEMGRHFAPHAKAAADLLDEARAALQVLISGPVIKGSRGWIATGPSGRVLHFGEADGWTVEQVVGPFDDAEPVD